MRRRKALRAGVILATGSVAGCLGLGGVDEEPESTPTTDPDEDQTTETTEEPNDGELSLSAEPSTTEIDWGDECTVSVTVQAGDDPVTLPTVLLYQTEDDSQGAGTFGNTEQVWQLEPGESQSETFDIVPPAVGEITLALKNAKSEDVVDEWELTVNPPVQPFGETLSYYDGLDMMVDVEVHEWLEFDLSWGPINDEDTGIRSVRPKDGQWVKVLVTAENTNMDEDVRLPGADKFKALAGNSQLDRPRALGTQVGKGTGYEVDDPELQELDGGEKPWLEMISDGEVRQEGYWYPPSDLIADAVEEGWMLFETDMDTTVEDIEARLYRNDILAKWK